MGDLGNFGPRGYLAVPSGPDQPSSLPANLGTTSYGSWLYNQGIVRF